MQLGFLPQYNWVLWYFNLKGDIMNILPLKNKKGEMVYHVIDEPHARDFWTYKEAEEYIEWYKKYVKPFTKLK